MSQRPKPWRLETLNLEIQSHENYKLKVKGKASKIIDLLEWFYRLEQNWASFLTIHKGENLSADHVQKEIKLFAELDANEVAAQAKIFGIVVDYEPPIFVASGHKDKISEFVGYFLEKADALYPKSWDKSKSNKDIVVVDVQGQT